MKSLFVYPLLKTNHLDVELPNFTAVGGGTHSVVAYGLDSETVVREFKL